MIVLYINSEHCTSLDQLKGYFIESLTPESDIYADLLDYGRHGDIAVWLREQGEQELSSKVASISTSLSDSAFYAELKGIITGVVVSDSDPFKPAFDKCFSFENIKLDGNETEVRVRVILKVLLCVNEEYEIRVSCNWGTRGMMVNPYSHSEGKTAMFDFTFHRRPGKDIDEFIVMADGKELSRISKPCRESGEINVADILQAVKGHLVAGKESGEITVGDIKFRMIHVDGGTFKMAPDYRKVTLSGYSIGETPVTEALWEAVMGNKPSFFYGAQKPVESVNWHDCQEFIKKLNKKTGRVFRLPTIEEWEFAARGGTKSKGYDYSGSNNLNEVGWYAKNSYGKPKPVMEKKPNELGIYDMSGNVWEWCARLGAARGGGWDSSSYDCHNYHTSNFNPDRARRDTGFRLALSE